MRTYFLYDERAITETPDDATVLDTADSIKEAKKLSIKLGYTHACVSYKVVNNEELQDERIEYVYNEGNGFDDW